MFYNMMPRQICGTRRVEVKWQRRRPHKEELYDMYSPIFIW
jgi:hypothetical protein